MPLLHPKKNTAGKGTPPESCDEKGRLNKAFRRTFGRPLEPSRVCAGPGRAVLHLGLPSGRETAKQEAKSAEHQEGTVPSGGGLQSELPKMSDRLKTHEGR